MVGQKLLQRLLVASCFLVPSIRYFCAGGKVPEEMREALGNELQGKNVIVTGGSSGIGWETVKMLSELGANVIIASRNQKQTKELLQSIDNPPNVKWMYIDLESLSTVAEFAAQISHQQVPIHYLINNAGVMNCPHAVTKDGYEIQFQVNHLSHFLLTQLLMQNLQQNKARVINVASRASERINHMRLDRIQSSGKEDAISPMFLYRQSKLCNIFFTQQLQRCHQLQSLSVHPGVVFTDLFRYQIHPIVQTALTPLLWLFLKSPKEGAQTTIYATLCPIDTPQSKWNVPNGSYMADCSLRKKNPLAFQKDLEDSLYFTSMNAIQPFLKQE